jgi:peptidoglycan/LPS O-acetylase OafA/YrhL
MNFRTDINALRATAVLGVVLFHFLSNALPGGFAGVDVFFVISGFLMTSIIFRGLDAQTFKVSDFYLARARRIVPALTVLSLALLALGWFYLHPTDFGTLGKHALGSLSFISNFMYLKESGYFDEASKEKWMLHTWSLSVEWQFYLVYPVVMVMLRKFMRLQFMRYVLVLGAVASFALCVYATGRWPSSAFYLLPTRAWEMLVGGLAFLYPLQLSNPAKKWLEALGIGLIVTAYVGLSEATAWPGYWAALPVAGALLVIAAHRERSWLSDNAALQWLGTVSYSVYLWHWPVVVWLNYAGKSADMGWVAVGVLLSVGLGALSYYGVENRKKWNAMTPHWMPCLGSNLGWAFVVATVTCITVVYQEGFASRLSQQYLTLTQQQVMPRRDNGYCFLDFNNDTRLVGSLDVAQCVLGARSQAPKILLFGDSFAGHFEPFWDELGKSNGVAINAITTNWCVPLVGKAFDGPVSHPSYQQCLFNRQILAKDMGKYDLVIFAGQWSNSLKGAYLADVKQTIRQVAKTVRAVVVMPTPTRFDTNVLKRFQRNLFYQTPFDLGQYTKKLDALEQEAYTSLRQDAQDLDNVFFLERSHLFAPSDTYSKSGYAMPYSLDGFHISLEGSLVAAQDFQKTIFYQQVVQSRLAQISQSTKQ